MISSKLKVEPGMTIKEQAELQIMHERNIATEYYIMKKYGAMYFVENWVRTNSELVSKNQLLCWLNDRGNRSGVISLYMDRHQDHFVRGKWQAYYLSDFIKFAVEKLISADYVTKKATREKFIDSLTSRKWFNNFVAVSCQKMMWELHKKKALNSKYARDSIEFLNSKIRQDQQFAKIAHHVAKNYTYHEVLKEINQLKYIIKTSYYKYYKDLAVKYEDEESLFRKYYIQINGELEICRSLALNSSPASKLLDG